VLLGPIVHEGVPLSASPRKLHGSAQGRTRDNPCCTNLALVGDLQHFRPGKAQEMHEKIPRPPENQASLKLAFRQNRFYGSNCFFPSPAE
jgi:hypothetical protein